jgi:uncharacterized protein YdaU (DUF1376 family)
MSVLPWHKHYHADALNGMASLPVDLRGVYYTILDLIYDRQGPLAESDSMMAARMCCSVRKWVSYRDALIRMDKITMDSEGRIINKRAENELKTSRKLAENGAKGGRARSENAKEHNKNNGHDEKGIKPDPKPQKPEPELEGAKAPSASEVVEEIWKLLPRKKRQATSKAKLLKPVGKLLKAKADPSRIIAAVGSCYSEPRHTEDDGQFAPAVYSWLGDGVWESWDAPAAQAVEAEDWKPLLRAYCETRQWPVALAGPAPHEDGCRAPTDLLEATAGYFRARDEFLSKRITANMPKLEEKTA